MILKLNHLIELEDVAAGKRKARGDQSPRKGRLLVLQTRERPGQGISRRKKRMSVILVTFVVELGPLKKKGNNQNRVAQQL